MSENARSQIVGLFMGIVISLGFLAIKSKYIIKCLEMEIGKDKCNQIFKEGE